MENTENKKCPHCEKELICKGKLIKRYNKTCGDKLCKKKSREIYNLEKYGHISNLHGKKEREKIIKNLKEKYGENITNISQLDYVKDKKIETCLKNNGVEHPMQSKDVMNKSIKTIKEKYGEEYDNISKIPFIIQKIIDSKYIINIDGITALELAKEQRKKTCLQKFGVEHYYQSDDFRNKYIQTCMDKFGVDNVWKSKYFKNLMIDKGIYLSDEEKTEKQKYYLEVLKYTNRSYVEFFDFINNENNRSIDFHLDHIYSIYDGFKNKIDPIILGSIINLQLLPAKINIKKNKNSWITLDELNERYNLLN